MWLRGRALRGAARGGRPAQAQARRSSSTRRTCSSRAPPTAFVAAIEQTVRLIRSKGVGVFFVTQTPKDVPGEVLAPARQPRPARAARLHARRRQGAARRPSRRSRGPTSTTSRSCCPQLGIGEAAVTILDERGVPTPVVHTRLRGAPVAHGARRRRRRRREGLAAVGEVRHARGRASRRARCSPRGWRRPRPPTRRREPAPTTSRPRTERAPKPAAPRRSRVAAGPGRRLPAAPARASSCRSRSCAASSACCARSCERERDRRRGPFTDEHEELRGVDPRASSPAELRPHAREWEHARWFPDERLRPHGRARAARPEVPRGATAARAATTCTTRCWSRSSRAAARAAWRPGSARTSASPRRRSSSFGTDEQKRALPRPRDPRREDRRARDHRARRRLGRRRHPHPRDARRRRLGRQRREDVHHERRARALLGHRGQDDRARAATTGSASSSSTAGRA